MSEPAASAPGSGGAPKPATPTTGNPHTAAAADALAAVDATPLAEHPEAYARIHGELQGALASIDHA